jgi:hypothetical protein
MVEQFFVGDHVDWKDTPQWPEVFRSFKNKLGEGPFTVTKVEEHPGATSLLTISKQVNDREMFHDGRRKQWVPASDIDLSDLPRAGGPDTFNAVYFEKVVD